MKKNRKIWIFIAILLVIMVFLIMRCNASSQVVESIGAFEGIGRNIDGFFSRFGH